MSAGQVKLAAGEPDEGTVLGYLESLSNWGRWGAEDERGTLNLITEESTRVAAATVQTGEVVACGREIAFGGQARRAGEGAPRLHFMERSGEVADPEGADFAADWAALPLHGLDITHLDAHAHVFWKGRLYNGRAASDVRTDRGAGVGGVDIAGRTGIVGRGVLLDVAALRGEEDDATAQRPISLTDLLEAERACGAQVGPGDVLLVRMRGSRPDPEHISHGAAERRHVSVGLGASCLPWLHERGIAALATDAGTDAMPSPYPRLLAPVHTVAVTAIGLWLVDNCDFEQLASACERLRRWHFLFTVAPIRLKRCTGAPVNPLATF
jgi:kynurenine formamidase